MRTGREETNQRSTIGAIDGTNGGQLVLGYGGNTSPTIGGASQWRLVAVGTEFRLIRSNSSNATATPLTIAESGAVTFAGASTFTAGLTSTTSLGLNVNPASGVALVRYSRADSGRWDVGITIDTESGGNTGTNFEIVRRSDTNTRIDAPLVITRSTGITTIAGLVLGGNPTIGPSGTSGFRDINFASTAGTLILRSNHSENKTYSFPDVVGVNSGTLALLEVPQPIVTSSSTGVTLNVAGGFFRLTNATGGANEVTLTLPSSASVPMPIGTVISFLATNGWANLSPAAGVTITNRTPFPLFFIPRGVTFELQKISTDGWELTCRTWSPSEVMVIVHEFLAPNSDGIFSIDLSGGTTATTTGKSTNPGNIQLSTSTSTSGRAGVITHSAAFDSTAGSGRIYIATEGCSVTTLSDNTETFVARIGLFNGTSIGLPGEGAFLQHSTDNSGNWEFILRDVSVTTSAQSSFAATTEANLSVLAKPGAAHVFSINGDTTSVGSNQVINLCRGGAYILKNGGTLARGLTIRRMTLIQELY